MILTELMLITHLTAEGHRGEAGVPAQAIGLQSLPV